MAKRRTKKKKPTITEQRRKNLLRAMKRTYGAYSPGAFELVQKASPQKIASLAKNRNKNLHKLSYYENPETASQTTEKELQKLYKRLEAKKEREDQRTKDWIDAVEAAQEAEQKAPDQFDFVEKEDNEPDINDFADAVDMGETIYNNVMEWLDTYSRRGNGETGKYVKQVIDGLINKYGKALVFAAMGNLPDDIWILIERLVYYSGKEANIEAAKSSFIRTIETTLTFME